MKKKVSSPAKKSSHFDKFAKKKNNAAIKEGFKQEKKQFKKERSEFFETKKAEARKRWQEATGQTTDYKGRPLDNKAATTNLKSQTVNLKPSDSGVMPLNKYIAHSGVCARRDAAQMVKEGLVKVNGNIVTEPGFKVSAKDDINVNGKPVFLEKNLVYILLNKPKDYITTTNDPQNRKTVLDLMRNATKERIYPVGRLDRNTSGVLLFTNDGDLSQKLTHPSNEIKKIYSVTLNKELTKNDFDKITKGLKLEDGEIKIDSLAYTDMKDKKQLGIEIHSGRNRIVRRIFEHLGYDVKALDRVMFGSLTKKNIERGKWRHLSEKEIRDLKYFGKGKR